MAAAARNALLKYLRVEAVALRNPNRIPNCGGSLTQLLRQKRHFSEEVRGSFLHKSEVTDRVCNVVKNFQKVDPSKVPLYAFPHFSFCPFNLWREYNMRFRFVDMVI
nr:acyl carrier protein 2, mitochondrial-like [Ipomoea batatas]GMC77185.1 acyl carrier protein 2, mitochondrial-like [Ipomoea batatas]